jgi:hypothetical protein
MQLQIIALFLVPNFSLHVLSGRQRCTRVILDKTEQKEKGEWTSGRKIIPASVICMLNENNPVSIITFLIYILWFDYYLCVFFYFIKHFCLNFTYKLLVVAKLHLDLVNKRKKAFTTKTRNINLQNKFNFHVSGASKRIFVTIKSTIDAVKFQIQYSYLHSNCHSSRQLYSSF